MEKAALNLVERGFCLSNPPPPQRRPRRAPSSADDAIKLESVISGDMRLRNDTSHDGWGGFFPRNRALSVMKPSVKEAPRGFFDKLIRCSALGLLPVQPQNPAHPAEERLLLSGFVHALVVEAVRREEGATFMDNHLAALSVRQNQPFRILRGPVVPGGHRYPPALRQQGDYLRARLAPPEP